MLAKREKKLEDKFRSITQEMKEIDALFNKQFSYIGHCFSHYYLLLIYIINMASLLQYAKTTERPIDFMEYLRLFTGYSINNSNHTDEECQEIYADFERGDVKY